MPNEYQFINKDEDDQDLTKPLVMPVKVGQIISVPRLSGYAQTSTVGTPCWGIPLGSWYCLTHQIVFPDYCAKDYHCKEPGTHIMAWLCKEHGPEVP